MKKISTLKKSNDGELCKVVIILTFYYFDEIKMKTIILVILISWSSCAIISSPFVGRSKLDADEENVRTYISKKTATEKNSTFLQRKSDQHVKNPIVDSTQTHIGQFKCIFDEKLTKNKTHFDDLNDDCKLMIFEQLDLADLLELRKMSPYFKELADYIFSRDFASKAIVFHQGFTYDRLVDQHNVLNLTDVSLIERLFKNYGPMISRLDISFKSDTKNESKEVIDLANRYCTDLKQLHLFSYDQETLDDVNAPFLSVENVLMYGDFRRLGSKTLQLNEIFPNLRTLLLDRLYLFDREETKQKYPKLQYLGLSLKLDEMLENKIYEMIKKNSQIQNVSLHLGTPRYISMIKNLLPQLENLELHSFSAENFGNFTLTTIKKLTVGSNTIDGIIFEALEELQFNFSRLDGDNWADFIDKHPKLIKLDITGDPIDETLLPKIVGKLPNLIEASFKIGSTNDGEAFVQFLKKSDRFEKLEISIENSERDFNEIFHK